MVFESFSGAITAMFAVTFVLAFIMGAAVKKTDFCTMGAVSDWVNMGDTGRMRSWLFAIAVAMLGVALFEFMGLVSADGTFPPYRQANLPWLEHALGGLLFGIGMSIASGCGQKTLVRVGGGNLKSVMVMVVMGIVAYYMINPLPGTAHTLYSLIFHPWMNPLAINMGGPSDLGSVLGGGNAEMARLIIGLVLAAAVLIYVFRSIDFRHSFDNILGGLAVGLVVVGAWYITSSTLIEDFGETYHPQEYVQEWDFLEGGTEGRPAEVAPWASQSFTFVNPMGQTTRYVGSGFDNSVLYFGVIALLGVIIGSFVWSLISRTFRFEWFVNFRDFTNHFFGAILMAVGGVLALGCTIGQAVTGISTLAIGGFISFLFIVLGATLTMKVQYYKMVYDEEATFLAALQTSLVDLHLLPKGMRKLESL